MNEKRELTQKAYKRAMSATLRRDLPRENAVAVGVQIGFNAGLEYAAEAMYEALKAIRDMPDHDQDNEHRMRNIAGKAIA